MRSRRVPAAPHDDLGPQDRRGNSGGAALRLPMQLLAAAGGVTPPSLPGVTDAPDGRSQFTHRGGWDRPLHSTDCPCAGRRGNESPRPSDGRKPAAGQRDSTDRPSCGGAPRAVPRARLHDHLTCPARWLPGLNSAPRGGQDVPPPSGAGVPGRRPPSSRGQQRGRPCADAGTRPPRGEAALEPTRQPSARRTRRRPE